MVSFLPGNSFSLFFCLGVFLKMKSESTSPKKNLIVVINLLNSHDNKDTHQSLPDQALLARRHDKKICKRFKND